MKQKTSIILLTLVSLLRLTFKAKPVSADSTTPSCIKDINKLTVEEAKQIGTVKYSDEDITVISFGNNKEIAEAINRSSSKGESNLIQQSDGFTPFTTVYGNCGYARLDVGDFSKRRALYWTIKTNFPYYSFGGTIKLRYYSGYSKNVPVEGYSGPGTYTSGYIYINRGNGGKATLVGKAYGSFKVASVLPGCSVGF